MIDFFSILNEISVRAQQKDFLLVVVRVDWHSRINVRIIHLDITLSTTDIVGRVRLPIRVMPVRAKQHSCPWLC